MTDLVIYYSRSGNTKKIARIIKKEVNADIIEIKDKTRRVGTLGFLKGIMDSIRNQDTKIEPSFIDVSKYDLIYIGSPVWASKPAPAIIQLLHNTDFTGKKVITFDSMMASGGEATINFMNEIVESQGGRVIKSFSIMNNQDLKESTMKALND
ncbi:MAG: flavodoxin [Methanosphaera stadtmanae]|nr:flavodoxin [Methanosphaera stadtmanae]